MFQFSYSLSQEKPVGHFDHFEVAVFDGKVMLGDRHESIAVAGIDTNTRRALSCDGRVYQLAQPSPLLPLGLRSMLGY